MAKPKKSKIVWLSESDLDADWIKHVRGGKSREEDLKAGEEAIKAAQEREKRQNSQ